jgi:hypothetical protein
MGMNTASTFLSANTSRIAAFAGLCAGVSFIEAGDDEVIDHIFRVLAQWRECDDVQYSA